MDRRRRRQVVGCRGESLLHVRCGQVGIEVGLGTPGLNGDEGSGVGERIEEFAAEASACV